MIERALVTEALQVMLTAATGKPCGFGRLPVVSGKPSPLPYTVLYPQGGSVCGAPLADRSEDARLVYQVTVVAARADQAEWLSDRVREALLGRTDAGQWANAIEVSGVRVWAREMLADDGVDPGGAGQGVVTAAARFGLLVSSSGSGA
ncbi:hypothetical protein ACO0M4_12150 [Streptomyces sp. RGM 3693]|uniref:hypothetical protein n=1 Tax=Streptomyces sp. RGM 3693 TaxID=3413284 RepID=UPI003D2CDF24